jgi:phosphatidylinositol alpha 1,6-mannosyltransferase
MQTADLRIALFSGNYNYVRDGANQALNRLADYLLRQGAAVRVYSLYLNRHLHRPGIWFRSPPCLFRAGAASIAFRWH